MAILEFSQAQKCSMAWHCWRSAAVQLSYLRPRGRKRLRGSIVRDTRYLQLNGRREAAVVVVHRWTSSLELSHCCLRTCWSNCETFYHKSFFIGLTQHVTTRCVKGSRDSKMTWEWDESLAGHSHVRPKGIVHYFTMSILKEQAVNWHHDGVILSF